MKVWLLDEGTPGHTVQTKGIGGLLAERLGCEIECISCRLNLRGWLRPLMRILVASARKGSALGIARRMYPALNLPAGKPDLVISSCGKSAYLNRLLCAAYGARGVFIGERKPFPAGWFDLILTPVSDGSGNELIMPVIETGQSAEAVQLAKEAFWPDGVPSGCWTMLIGGASRSHPFEADDWEELGKAMNGLAEKQGIRWLVTTSRRTGTEAERILKKQISPKNIGQAVWWDEEPKKCVGAFLGAGERIFVTQDSLSMMSEGLSVGKKVGLILPKSWEMPEESFNGRYVGRLQAEGLVERIRIADLAGYDGGDREAVAIGEKKEEFVEKLLSWVRDGRMVS